MEQLTKILLAIDSPLSIAALIAFTFLLLLKWILVPQIKSQTKGEFQEERDRPFKTISNTQITSIIIRSINYLFIFFVLIFFMLTVNQCNEKFAFNITVGMHSKKLEQESILHDVTNSSILDFGNITYDGSHGNVYLGAFICVENTNDCLPKQNLDEYTRPLKQGDNYVKIDFKNREWIEQKKAEGKNLKVDLYIKTTGGKSIWTKQVNY